MTSINAGGAFYRVQNEMANNSDRLSQSMQRLASGKQNIAPGDRTSSTAVAFAMKAESASLKVGMMNGTEALQSIEMVTNDLSQLNDIVVRLEEIHSLGTNAFVTTQDRSALTAEANNLLAEMTRISGDAKWKGNAIIKTDATDTTTNTMSFGRNTATIDIVLDEFKIPEVALGFNTVGDSIYGDIDISTGTNATGTAYSSLTTTPQAVAARTVADTKAGDKVVQSKLEINGAVFYEHLTKLGQDKFIKAGTADSDGASLTRTPNAEDPDRFVTAIKATLNQSLTVIASQDNNVARQLQLTAVGDSSTASFTVTGTDANGKTISEVMDGLGASGASLSTNLYKSVTSIVHSGVALGTGITVAFGTEDTAKSQLTLDGASSKLGTVTNAAPRQVTIKSAGNDTGTAFTVIGTDINGTALSENVTGANNGTATSTAFFKTITSIIGANAPAGAIEIGIGASIGSGPVELAGSDIGSGSAEAALALLELKTVVDNMNINAGTLFNKVSNTMSHMGSLNAGYQLDLASKMDVDFAGETAELAKGQILAQAGTAMLAQANAQRQGMLALLQS